MLWRTLPTRRGPRAARLSTSADRSRRCRHIRRKCPPLWRTCRASRRPRTAGCSELQTRLLPPRPKKRHGDHLGRRCRGGTALDVEAPGASGSRGCGAGVGVVLPHGSPSAPVPLPPGSGFGTCRQLTVGVMMCAGGKGQVHCMEALALSTSSRQLTREALTMASWSFRAWAMDVPRGLV